MISNVVPLWLEYRFMFYVHFLTKRSVNLSTGILEKLAASETMSTILENIDVKRLENV